MVVILSNVNQFSQLFIRLSDNFATKVDQSYRYGFGGLFFWKTVYVTHFHSLVFTLSGRTVHGVGKVSSRRNVS